MRHHMLTRLALAFALLLAPIAARAQDHNFPTPGGAIVDGVVLMCLDVNGNAVPATTAGTCLGGGGGSGTVNSGLINQLAYYAAGGTTVSGLATCASGVIVTSAGSVPSCSTTLPSGLAATNLALTTPTIGGNAITLGGAFTTSGAFTTTLTVTGNTNVTLPTSGTLATTSQLLPIGGSNTHVQFNNSGAFGGSANFTWDGTGITLGASGTLGYAKFGNATTGTVTLQPVTGALGTVTASLPANTGTIAELNLAQSWTALQTFSNGIADTGGTLAAVTGFGLRDTSAAFDVTLAATSSVALTAGRTLTLNMGNVAHTLSFGTTASTGSGIIFPNTATDTVAMLGVANSFSAPQTMPSYSVVPTATASAYATTASGALNNTTTGNITVSSTTGWPSSGTLYVYFTGTGINKLEFMSFTVVDGTTLNITARGTYGTTAVAHANISYITYLTNTVAVSTSTRPQFTTDGSGGIHAGGYLFLGSTQAGGAVYLVPANGDTGMSMSYFDSNTMGFSVGSVSNASFAVRGIGTAFGATTSKGLGFASASAAGAGDVNINRLSTTVLQVGTAAAADSTGALLAANLQTGGSALLTLTAGAFGMSKMTASASAPGAAGGKLELVCGTNAGSAKLIAAAGTSTTAVTIIDNIGSGVTGC